MIALIMILAISALFAALGFAAMRWGVDSRSWTRDGRAFTILGGE
jgi:nitrogen fixation-related uncharacterized protein